MDAFPVANIVGLAAMIAGLIRLIAGSVASNVGFGVRQLQIMSVENHARLQVCRFSIAGRYTYWVKAVLDRVIRLDPVDAANWMEVIADVTARRADEALAAGLAAGEEQREERIPEPLRRFLGGGEGYPPPRPRDG